MEEIAPILKLMLESSATVAIADSEFLTQKLIEFNRFLEYMPVAVAMFDRHRRCLVASELWIQNFGENPENLMSCSLERTTLETTERWQDVQSHSLAGATSVWEETVVYIDGMNQWVKWKVQPWYDELGEVGGEVVCLEPQCDRKSVEELAQQSLQELEDLKRAIDRTAMVCIADSQGNITDVNENLCRTSQYSRAELLGRNHRILNSGEGSPEFFERMRSIVASGQVWQGELKNRAKDGTFYWVDLTVVPCVNDRGTIYQYIFISTEIGDRKKAEIKFQESEQLLQLVLDNIPQFIYWKDRQSVFLGCNRSGARFAGLNSPEEIIGKTDYDGSATREEAEWYRDCDRRVMESGVADLHIIETQQKAEDKVAWLDTSKIPLRNTEGEVVGILVTIEDITKRKQAEEILQRSNEELELRVQERTNELEEVVTQLKHEISDRQRSQQQLQAQAQFLQSIWDGVDYGIFILDVLDDAEEFRFAQFNPNSNRTSPRPISQLLGKTLAESFPPDAANSYRQRYQECVANECSINYEEHLEVDGVQTWWWVNLTPLRNETGEITRIVATLTDLTQRKSTETALAQSESRFRNFVENANDLIYFVDAENRVTYLSPQFSQMFGYDIEEFQGQSFLSLVHPDDLPQVTHATQRLFEAGQPQFGLEFRARHRDESWVWVVCNDVPIQDAEGRIVGYQGIARDITERRQIEENLQEKEKRLREINNLVPGAIYQYETHLETGRSRFTYISPKVQEIFEVDRDPVLASADPIWQIIHPEDLARLEHSVTRAVQEHSNWFDEFRIITASGKEKWIRGQSVSADAPEGFALHNGVFIDISDRKAAEAKLQQQEQLLRSVYDGSELVMFVINVEENGDFRYVDWNSAAERVTGVDRTQIIGKTPEEIYGSVSGKIERRRLKQCLATGRAMSYEESVNIGDVETYWITTINPLKDSNAKIYRIVGSAIDITDRKEIEAALSQSEAKFRYFVENANDLICSVNFAREFTYLSPKFLDITGYEIDEFLGQSFVPITHPDDLLMVDQSVQQVVATGKPYSGMEFRVLHKNGRWIWLTSNLSPIREPDHRITGIQSIVRDITERKAVELQLKKQTEELENAFEQLKRTQAQMLQSEKMSSLGQMVAGVAHEINNPVNFIHGNLTHAQSYLEDLLEVIELYQVHYPEPVADIQLKIQEIELEFLVQDLTKLFQSMRVGTNRIREIVLSLRNFSRLDESDFKESDIHHGLDSTLMILQNRLKSTRLDREGQSSRHLGIEVIKKYGNLPLVDCYPGQLNQVFMNILSNAIDALEDRDKLRTLENISQHPSQISIETEFTPSNTVRIRIKDNGIGIPEPIQTRIFDPFFTTKDVGKGTGLGMSISYQIITDRHQGSIYCMSSPGQGSEFIVEIPIHQKPRSC